MKKYSIEVSETTVRLINVIVESNTEEDAKEIVRNKLAELIFDNSVNKITTIQISDVNEVIE